MCHAFLVGTGTNVLRGLKFPKAVLLLSASCQNFLYAVLAVSVCVRAQLLAQAVFDRPRSPVIEVVGCARPGDASHVWILSDAGERSESTRVAIAPEEKPQLSKRPLGHDRYQLIGVADFVDADAASQIGVRGQILSKARMNTTGMLAAGHRVAVKGLYIGASPPRINLMSVVDLAATCP